MKGTARENQARSEPETGASPEAGVAGHPPGAADRTRVQGGSRLRRARPLQRERVGVSLGYANLGGTAKRLRPMGMRGVLFLTGGTHG